MSQNKKIGYVFLTLIITLVITISYMHLWGTNIKVPLTGYRSDSIGVLLEANNYVRGGDVHRNVCYGAPNVNSYTYSIGDSSVPMPLIKILAHLTGSVEAAINIHAIMNSVLLACSMCWICIRLKIHEIISMIAGISYSCLSFFVLWCNTLLLIYGFCFYIPLFCYIVINLMSTPSEEMQKGKNKIFSIIFIIGVMFFAGLNSAYYVFFIMIILAFAGAYTLIALKSIDNVLLVVTSYIAIGVGIAIYSLPDILCSMNSTIGSLVWNSGYYYWGWLLIGIILCSVGIVFYKKIYPHITLKTIWVILACLICMAGIVFIILKKYTNFIGVYEGRSLYAVELGALNIVNIVLPAINNISQHINTELPMVIDLENQDVSALGVLTGIGFIYSILCVFQLEHEHNHKNEVARICGLCNCFMVIVAIKGGGASLIASYITTGIRNYNRMCVFIAVFSLIAFGVLVEKIFKKIRNVSNAMLKKILYVGLCIFIIGGMTISCPTDFIVNDSFGLVSYEQRKREYEDWQSLMNNIESNVPVNGMILELPLTMDGAYFGKLMEQGRAYELSIPAILSKTTAWSYAGGWNTTTSIENETEQFISEVYNAGFEGIYMDTLLYSDNSYKKQLESLQSILGQPIVCNENRRYFFSLAEYKSN